MRHFDKIVLTDDEPVQKYGTLWLRRKRQVILDPDSKEQMKESLSVWMYGDNGWESIADFDTKYVLRYTLDTTAKNNPVDIVHKYDSKTGITDINFKLRVFDNTRTVGDNGNLVNEKALRDIVVMLNNNISAIDSNFNNTIKSLTNRVNELQNRIEELENNN